MDFFDHQERAYRRSRWLVVWFVLAVVGIVFAVYTACTLTIFGMALKTGRGGSLVAGWWDERLFLWVAGVTLGVIVLGTLYKTAQLSSGGEAVAQTLGGHPIDPNTQDLRQRRLLNVVEEMSLAAGLPVPTVYLLEKERGINAFAAGLTPGDAVLGVSEGCLDHLSRDELQGVIGHELSHVLRGDMRLNLRLMGLLHGILVIALIGYWTLRSARFTVGGGRRGGGGSGAAVALLALSLLAIGWIGVFFGRLIKSAVSRQREFLADAASVQFTRNPDGIAGALKKIGGLSTGSRLLTPAAEEASHLFFGNALRPSLFAALSTHPPLEERIRRLEPNWDGTYPEVRVEAAPPSTTPGAAGFDGAAVAGLAGAQAASSGAPPLVGVPPTVTPRGTMELDPAVATSTVGTVDDKHRAYVASLLDALPAGVRSSLREPAGATAVVYALLLDDEPEVLAKQLAHLEGASEGHVFELTRKVAPALKGHRSARLLLAELAVPALRTLSPRQYETFWQNVRALVTADEKVSLFEYSLQRLIKRHLAPTFGEPEPARGGMSDTASLGAESSVLLSALAHVSGDDETTAAFAAGSEELRRFLGGLRLLPPEECTLQRIDRSLRQLARTGPKLKRELVRAAAATVAHDRRVTLEEGELLRAVCDALDCPMPPLLPGETL